MKTLSTLLDTACRAFDCTALSLRSESRNPCLVYARVIFLLLARAEGYRDYVVMWHIGRDKSSATYYLQHLDRYKQSSTFLRGARLAGVTIPDTHTNQ